MAKIGWIDIIENSQDIANCKTNITVKGIIQTTGESWRGDHRQGTYTIKQDSNVLKSGSFTHGAPANSTTTLFEVTLDVTHDVNGNSGTITVTYNYDSGWCTGTQSETLTKINRKSTLLVENGTLGEWQDMYIDRESSSFTHTITYKCGSTSGTICSKTKEEFVRWTPPLSLASQNTTGTSITVKITLETFSGNTSLGTNSYTKVFAIPKSVSPTIKVAISEASEQIFGWDVYVQYVSKLNIKVNATPAYGADIVEYEVVVEGKTYTKSEFTTDVLTMSGTNNITIYVKDQRGRTTNIREQFYVMPYNTPIISDIKVKRCNEDGKENIQGEFGKVSFHCSCYPLNNNNELNISIYYKKVSENNYTFLEKIAFGSISGNTGELSSSVFPATSASAFNVQIVATDILGETTRTTTLSTGYSIMHFLSSGLGLAVGKVAELPRVFDIGFMARFFKGIKLMEIQNKTDWNTLQTTNTYHFNSSCTFTNAPEDGVNGILEVLSDGFYSNGDGNKVQQICRITDGWNPRTYVRSKDVGWKDWICISGDFVVEEGTSGIWTYRKWQSGVCEMWGTYQFTPSLASSGTFHYQNITLDLPITLIQKFDAFNATVKYSNFISFVMGKEYESSSSGWKTYDSVTFTYLQYNNASQNSTEISLSVKGRWK